MEPFFNASVDLLCVLDQTGIFQKINSAASELLGYSEAEIIGKHLIDFLHPDDRKETLSEFANVATRDYSKPVENRFICKDGSVRWLSWKGRVEANLVYAVGRDITDIENVKKHSEDSQQKLNHLLDFAPVVLTRIHPLGIITFSAGSALKSLGRTNNQNVGKNIFDLYPENHDAVICFKKAIAGESCAFQMVLNGRVLENKFSPTRNANHEIDGIIAVSLDITDTIRAKEESDKLQSVLLLQKAERKFKETFEYLGVGICHVSPTGIILLANAEARRLFGRTEVELIGKIIKEFTHPDDHALDERMGKRLASGEVPRQDWEKRYIRKDGTVIWVSLEVSAVKDSSGRIRYNIVAQKDITKRRAFEEALKKSENSFRYLAEAIPQIVWITGVDGELQYCNQRWFDYTNVSMEVGSKNGWSEVIHPDDSQNIMESWQRALQFGTEFECEMRLKSGKTGEYRWHLGRALPMKDESGAVLRWFGTSTDIHEQKIISEEKTRLLANEKAAVEASRLKSEFLANMSHEIRTPLNGLIGMIQLLQETKLNSEQREYLNGATKSSEMLFGLVNDVLDLSKIEAGKLEAESSLFDLNSIFKDINLSLKSSANQKSLRFEVSGLQPECFLIGDAKRLQQVVYNIAHNAIKFTHHGYVKVTPEVSFADAHAHVKIKIEDSGIGISSEYMKNIFSPFSQADSSITRKYGGTGLGLSICKQLTDLLGGTIDVQSEVGKGTTFTLAFSFKKANPVQKKIRNQQPQSSKFLKKHILVAEDNETSRLLIERQIQKFGHALTLVQNGMEALEACKKSVFDLVFMDCHMPEMDGFEASLKIRNDLDSLNQEVPIFATTADVVKGIQERCSNSGMTGYISKPLSLDRLKQVVDSVPSRTQYFKIKEIDKLAVLNSMGMTDLRIELVNSFLNELPLKVSCIEESFAKKDFKELQKLVHTLKSSAAAIGAHRIFKICKKMEELAVQDQEKLLGQLLVLLKSAQNPSERILKAYVYQSESEPAASL